MTRQIPKAVIAVVSDALGNKYSHAAIDQMMEAAGIEFHLLVIAEEVSRVAVPCIGRDIGTMGTAKAFTEMEAGRCGPKGQMG
jgi:hypothetical protein